MYCYQIYHSLIFKTIFCSCETCLEVFEQTKLLYTNDTHCLYCVCQNLFNVIASRRLDGIMAEYLGKIYAYLHDFNELLHPVSTPSQELEQRSNFFMFLALHSLPDDYAHVRD